MIYLRTNDATKQTVYLTASNRVKDFGDNENYWLRFTNMVTFKRIGCFAEVISKNERYIQLGLYTNENDAVAGRILLKDEGLYMYEVFFVDGDDASSVPAESELLGPLTSGLMRTNETGTSIATIPDITTPTATIYYPE